MKFLIDLNLDSYESPEEEQEACKEFIMDQLNMSASGVKILWMEDPNTKPNQEAVEMGVYQ